ncbi:MAG: SRPBCC family protein [Planctomycetota bacterium]|nr:SRPBCC family protein [Planctomycetota bacterium]MDA1247976.1 SRPBCC family protein [Planctomycetota bacterium]
METFEARLTLPCNAEVAFDFLAHPENIKRISPPDMGLFFLEAPKRLSLGARMQFKVQAFGVAREAIHEITQFDEPGSFTEQQVKGPLGHWVHEHLFEPDDEGAVTIIDRIEFQPPGGVVGLLVNADRILESLEEGFDHRHDQLEKLLGFA